MAKSARSSIKKTNKTRLKSRVFGPAEDARTKRLSEKLMALASESKPVKDVDMEKPETAQQDTAATGEEDDGLTVTDGATMDVDGENATKPTGLSRSQQKKRKEAKAAKVDKKRHRKATNRMTFTKKRSTR